MEIVGLTGGIASGKSTVGRFLRELGADVIDADIVAREVVAADTAGLDAVRNAFGSDYLTAEGELVPEALEGEGAGSGGLEWFSHPCSQ